VGRPKCLSKEELRIFLGLDDGPDENRRLAEDWEQEQIGLSYFLSQILEREQGSARELISDFMAVEDGMWFSVEECGPDFVDFLLRNRRDTRLSLSEELIARVEDHRAHNYQKTVRV